MKFLFFTFLFISHFLSAQISGQVAYIFINTSIDYTSKGTLQFTENGSRYIQHRSNIVLEEKVQNLGKNNFRIVAPDTDFEPKLYVNRRTGILLNIESSFNKIFFYRRRNS